MHYIRVLSPQRYTHMEVSDFEAYPLATLVEKVGMSTISPFVLITQHLAYCSHLSL